MSVVHLTGLLNHLPGIGVIFTSERRRSRTGRSLMRRVPLAPLVTVIALSLVAVSPAGAQRPSDLARRKLSAVTVIDGIACGETGARTPPSIHRADSPNVLSRQTRCSLGRNCQRERGWN
jgi:hypothetical protein